MPDRRFAFGPFVLDAEAGTLLRKGAPVPVPYRAFLLLAAFLDRPGEVLTKSDLIDAAWQGAAVEEGNLSVQVAALRSPHRQTKPGSASADGQCGEIGRRPDHRPARGREAQANAKP